MKKVFAVEMKRAINIGWIISILGVCFLYVLIPGMI